MTYWTYVRAAIPKGWAWSVGLAFTSLVNLTGCGSSCTLSACNPHAELYFAHAVKEPGRYRAEVETKKGGVVSCEATLPLSDKQEACSAAGVSWIVSGPQSGSASGTTQGSADTVTGVNVDGQHELIQVRLFRDDAVLGEASVQPRYVGKEINGAGCGECPLATEDVPMP